MAVATVIIHYGRGSLTDHVLTCLEKHRKADSGQVIVVDNESPEPYALPPSATAWARLVRLDPGQGFGGACEAGVKAAPEASAWVILNNDLSFRGDLVGHLAGFLKSHPRAGIVGPALVFPDGRFQLSWGDDLTLGSERLERARQQQMHAGSGALYESRRQESRQARRVDWISGAAFAISREAFQAIGTLEAGYFFYFEDCDWCRRAREAGFEVWYEPAVAVEHALGASKPTRDLSPKALRFYRERELGHLRYYARFNSCGQAMLLQALLALKALLKGDGTLFRMLLRPGLRRSLATGPERKARSRANAE